MENSTVEETQVVQATPGGQVQAHTVKTQSTPNDFLVSKVNQVLISVVVIINILIGLRFLFSLFGANQVGIVNFIFLVSEIFVIPFKGIFDSPAVGSAYFDMASILAIILWTVLAWILAIVVKMFSSRTDV